MSGKKSYRQAYAWAYAGRWTKRIFSVIVTFILARQLSTKDFGLVALALVYVSFLEVFLSTGFSAAIVQRADLRDEHLHSAFWINVMSGLLLAGVCVLMAPWWSRANNSPQLYQIILVLSASIPIHSLVLVQQAILQRGLDFKTITIRTAISLFAGGLTAIGMALSGYGVWALVAQHMVTPIVGLVTLWAITAWRPKFVLSFQAARELLTFSGNILLSRLAVFATARADTYLMGLLFRNPAVVGVYRLAESLMQMVLQLSAQSINWVSFAQFSRSQGDLELARTQYLKLLHFVAVLVMPAFLLLAAVADPLMECLGERWLPAADVLKLLCLVGIFQSMSSFSGPVLNGLGKPGLFATLLWTAAFFSNVTFAAAGLLFQDVPDDLKPVGIAAARLALTPLVYVPLLMIPTFRYLKLGLMDLLKAVAVPFLAGAAAFATATLVTEIPGVERLLPFPRLLLLGLLGGAPAAAIILALDQEAVRLGRSFLRSGKGKAREENISDVPS